MSEEVTAGFVHFIENELGEGTWVPLYKSLNTKDKTQDGALFSCLAPSNKIPEAMKSYGWDLSYGSGGPSIVMGSGKVWYEPQSSEYLPLVIVRDFYGRRESYKEVLQELVLYLNLFHDVANSKYLVDDDNGTQIDVIRYSEDEIQIRMSFLKAFMAARQMHLLLFFENIFHSDDADSNLAINTDNICLERYSGGSYVDGYKMFTRVVGKKLFNCQPLTEESSSPFNNERVYEEFIIGGDEHDSIMRSCDPSLLADYFGKNEGAPHYLTQVFFSKDVLQKYFASSSEYEVQDSMINKPGYWRLRIDNNAKDHVCVFLGDLGRDIPNSEQKYWKSFNIGTEDKRMSETYFQRSMLGQFADAQSPDLRFKSAFERFQQAWLEKHGWSLFLPLADSDKHCFNSLHSLTKNEQSEFDSQVLSLVKITIDSINVKGIKSVVSTDETGSIKILSVLLKEMGVDFETSSFLGGLQGVRSTGVAHRRGSKYEKTIERLGIDDGDLVTAFDNILNQMIELISAVASTLETESA